MNNYLKNVVKKLFALMYQKTKQNKKQANKKTKKQQNTPQKRRKKKHREFELCIRKAVYIVKQCLLKKFIDLNIFVYCPDCLS